MFEPLAAAGDDEQDEVDPDAPVHQFKEKRNKGPLPKKEIEKQQRNQQAQQLQNEVDDVPAVGVLRACMYA